MPISIEQMQKNLLHGARVRLTALNKEDAATIARWYEDGGYLRLQDTNMARPHSEAEIIADLQNWNESSDTIVLAIRTIKEHTLIGTLGFYEIEWSNQVAWLGIGIGDRAYWDQGLGSEALQLGLYYAFNEMNLYRLQLTVIEYNERAISMYEKFGFKREGTFRQFGWRDGQRYDMFLYGILRSDLALEGRR